MIFYVIFMAPWNKKSTKRKDYEIYSFVSGKSVQVKGFSEMYLFTFLSDNRVRKLVPRSSVLSTEPEL